MLIVIDIAKLIADKACIPDDCLLIGMRVSENPRINTAVCNKVTQLRCKGTIKQAAFMLGSHNGH